MEFHFSFINIGVLGIGGIFIFILKTMFQRYSFVKYIKNKPEILLLTALCKAEVEGYRFIRVGKEIVLIGHTQNNKWIKPYECIIDPHSKSQFLNEQEIYNYKIDLFLLLMIKCFRIMKCKKIVKIKNKIPEFDENNSKKEQYYKFEFFKHKSELPKTP